MSATPEGGVNVRPTGRGNKKRKDFVEEDRRMKWGCGQRLYIRLEYRFGYGFIRRRLVIHVFFICPRIPDFDPFEDAENQHFVFNAGKFLQILRNTNASLAVQL